MEQGDFTVKAFTVELKMYQFLTPNGATGIDVQKFPCPKAFIYRGASVAHGNLTEKTAVDGRRHCVFGGKVEFGGGMKGMPSGVCVGNITLEWGENPACGQSIGSF